MDELGQVGAIIAGCRLGAVVGAGAGSQVWLATDRADGRRVAVKLSRGPLPVGERLRVRHPHLIVVHRASEDPTSVVMDFAEGGSLAALVAARGPLDAGEVVTVLAALAAALGELHATGVVHGDVTGTNVLFMGDGRPVFGDLGALRVAGAGPVVATDGYAAPEVAAGLPGGWAADVYGLAAVAWLALTGAAPAVCAARAPLSVLAPRVPDGLVDVISRGLDPDPARRPVPQEVVAVALAAAAAEPVRLVAAAMPVLASPEAVTHRLREWSVEARTATRPGAAPTVPAVAGGGRRASQRRRRLAVTAMAGAVLGVMVAAVGVVLRDDDATAAGLPPEALPVVTLPAPASAGDGAPVAQVAVAPSGGAAGDPQAATADVVITVARDLIEARTATLRSGDVDALDAVYQAGAAAAADRRLLERDGAVDVTVTVASTEVVDSTPGAATVIVAMATEIAPGPSGTGAATSAVRVDLVLTPDGWRIADVVPAGPDR